MGAGSGGMKGDMPRKSHDDMPSGGNHDLSESISDE